MSSPATLHSAQGAAVGYDPFAGGAVERVLSTTESQRELWLAAQLGDEASMAFNESVSLHLRGELDRARLERALQAVVDRHDSLRTSFGPEGDVFCVLEPAPQPLSFEDLSALTPAGRDARLAEYRRQGVETPFALHQGRLFRAELVRIAPQEHVLLMHAHHAVCDGWSWWVIVRELGAIYAHGGDAPAALPPADSYVDYALADSAHQSGPEFARDERYWLSQFAGQAPVLELPTDRPRPAWRGFASRREDHMLDAGLVAALRRLGARRGASLFAVLLGAFASLLSRIAGQPQVVIGIPAAGQSINGHDHLVGHCVNLLPLNFEPAPEASFHAVVDGAQTLLLDAIEHQRYTFGTLLKALRIARDPARLPLVSVMFNIDQALDLEQNRIPGLELEFTTNPRSYENFELSVNAVQVDGCLRLEAQYNSGLFDARTVRGWLSAFEVLLRAAVDAPEAPAARLPLLDEAGLAGLRALQPAPVPFDRACRMHELFERQCDREPDRVALRFEGAATSYRRLEARANRIAHLLRGCGVGRGALVGLAVDRGVDMVAALLGILKAGAGYVPLDPRFPADRLAYMAADAGLAALLTQARHAAGFDLGGRPVLALDALEGELDALPEERPGRDARAAEPESPAYVIYTSGSTGRPKGVMVPHRAVSNFITGMQAGPGLHRDERLLAVTTLSFDIAVLELMLPLSVGAEVILAGQDTVADGFALADLLESSGATVMQATPAGWRLLLEAGWEGREGFRAMCGGEPLPLDLAQALLARGAELWNLYGPTETTVWSTAVRVEGTPRGGPDIHIGRPIANTQVWILDEGGQPCPRGVPGEICIGGEGVTLGYLGRSELTAERFLPDAFADADRGLGAGIPAPLLYRTGDRGRWRSDGNLEHMGRLDFQVKVRGYRIEPGEIEACLAAHPAVARVVVLVREDRAGDARLVAYVVARVGRDVDGKALSAHLLGMLPDYMVPQHFMFLEEIPLLPNGKIDRRALPAPTQAAVGAARATAAMSPSLAYVSGLCTELIGVRIGADDNFFEAGGHSLLAVKLLNRIRKQTGVRINLLRFASSTISQVAELLPEDAVRGFLPPSAPGEGDVRAPAERAPERAPAPDGGPAPAPEEAPDGVPVPILFGARDRRLFGVFRPADGQARLAVLVCPPLLHEHVRSYRFFSGVAGLLADHGVASLRFDYFGTGDSGGDTTEFSPERALEDIAQAVRELRARAGGAPLVLMGVRASSLLVRACAREVGASSLWLWQPVADVREYLGELDALDAAERSSRLRYPFSGRGPAAEAHESMGFLLSPTFRDELHRVAERAACDAVPAVVLDVARAQEDGLPPGPRLVLPDEATGWLGQVEMEGVIPARSVRDAVASLVYRTGRGAEWKN